MIIHSILKPVLQHRVYIRTTTVLGHPATSCPVKKRVDRCPGSKGKAGAGASSGGGGAFPPLKRGEPGKVRLGLIPEEWFQFFYSKTGVSGPYFLLLGLTNYLISKEIYVMEHEYYSGLSEFAVIYYISTKFGPSIGAYFDKEVDAISEDMEKGRKEEIAAQEAYIKDSETAIWRAEGQKVLMDAKKENIALQLEAAYRERLMLAYLMVRGRLEYQVKVQRLLSRIHQKWMIHWILTQVSKAITPDFEKQALDNAIKELEILASRSSAK